MKTLLVPCGFLPESVGGTEIYVYRLAMCLRKLGVKVQIALTQKENGSAVPYDHDGLSVRRLPAAQKEDASVLNEAIEAVQPDIVHFHPLYLTPVLPVMEAAKDLGLPTVCTYHTATLTCGRGDMLLWGREPCDGRIEVRRCTACVAHQRGLPRFAGRFLARSKPGRNLHVGALPRKALSMLSLAAQRADHLIAWQRVVSCIDHWIAVCEWVRDVLLINGVDPDKVTLSRHGLFNGSGLASTSQVGKRQQGVRYPIRLGYLGRISPEKGLHVLLKTMGLLRRDGRFRLDIAGGGGGRNNGYEARLRAKSADNPGIRWIGAVAPAEVHGFLRQLDALVIPSVTMETGPMTVLEAWDVGTPVVGSDLGGLHELLGDGKGWLFRPGDAWSLSEVLERLAKELVGERYTAPMGDVRTGADVADEMVAVYESLLLPQDLSRS